MVRPLPRCQGESSICSIHEDTARRLLKLQRETDQSIKDTVNNIKLLIPEHRNNQTRSRSHRSVLPVIGDISSSVFGTATERDVKHLRKHLINMYQQNQRMSKTFQQQENNLASYMTAVDDRISNAMHGIEENHKLFHNITEEMQITLESTMHVWSKLSDVTLQYIKNTQQLELRMQQIAVGVQEIINGKLSPFLIPVSTINETLNHLKDLLNTKYPEFHIVNTNMNYYYETLTVNTVRSGNTIFITISIPISSSHNIFKLYQVLSFPVPLNHTTKHATQLSETSPYIAVSSNSFIEMSHFSYSQCTGTNFKHCSLLLGQQSISHLTCISAIFFQYTTDVKSLCNFEFIHSGVKEFILELEPSKVLMSAVNNVSISCANLPNQIQSGCNFCVLNIPCHCSLQAGSFHLPSRINNCHSNSNQQITKLYPVNLALLQSFFDDKQINAILGDTLYSKRLNATVPNFKLYEHEFSNTLTKDHKLRLDLKQMAHYAKNNASIYQSIIDPIFAGDWQPQEKSLSDKYLFDIILIAIVILSVLSSTLAIYRTHKLLIVVRTLTNIKAYAMELEPPVLTWKGETTHEPTTTPSVNDSNDNLFVTWLAILTVVVICKIVHKLIKRCRNKGHTKISIQVSNGVNCLTIPVLSLYLCSDSLMVHKDHILLNIRKTKCIPVLCISWNQTKVINKLNGSAIKLPTSISINPYQCIQIHNMLQQTDTATVDTDSCKSQASAQGYKMQNDLNTALNIAAENCSNNQNKTIGLYTPVNHHSQTEPLNTPVKQCNQAVTLNTSVNQCSQAVTLYTPVKTTKQTSSVPTMISENNETPTKAYAMYPALPPY